MIPFLDIDTTNRIISFVTFGFIYGLIVTLSGSFKARLAARWGDDTAAELGFVELDPLRHFDIWGFFFFSMLGFGWGRYIPVNRKYVHGTYARLKGIVALFGDTVTYIAIAFGMVFVFLVMFGYPLLDLAIKLIQGGHLPSQYLFSQVVPKVSSLRIMILFVYAMFLYTCILFGVISAIMNLFHITIGSTLERTELYQLGSIFFVLRIVLLYVLTLLLLGPIYSAMFSIINYASIFFAYCLGVLT